MPPWWARWARGSSAWARAGPVSACAQPSWLAGAQARPCTRAHLSAARRCLVRRWVRPRPAAKPAVECKAARATAPGARPAAQDPRGLPSPRTNLHLSKFCVNTHKFFRLVAIFQRQGGRGLHKHAPDEHTAEGTICFRLRTENISVNANDHQESVIMMEPMTTITDICFEEDVHDTSLRQSRRAVSTTRETTPNLSLSSTPKITCQRKHACIYRCKTRRDNGLAT